MNMRRIIKTCTRIDLEMSMGLVGFFCYCFQEVK